MGDRNKDRRIDENFFKHMNYEIAAEHSAIDNEEMKDNRKLNSWKRKGLDDDRKQKEL